MGADILLMIQVIWTFILTVIGAPLIMLDVSMKMAESMHEPLWGVAMGLMFLVIYPGFVVIMWVYNLVPVLEPHIVYGVGNVAVCGIAAIWGMCKGWSIASDKVLPAIDRKFGTHVTSSVSTLLMVLGIAGIASVAVRSRKK